MRAQDGSDEANTRMTLVRDHLPRKPNWPVSPFVQICPHDARVTPGVLTTGSVSTVPGFPGIVTARLGKTAREGGRRMALLGHAEEQCRHVTWGASERTRDQRRR